MNRLLLPLLKLIAHIVCVIIMFFLFRMCFLLFNHGYFDELYTTDMVKLIIHGLRFDISAVLVINSLFLLLSLLPFHTIKYSAYQKLLKIVFIIPNSIAILFEIGDWMYFPFNHKRSTADVLQMISRKGDFFTLLPSFLKDYWFAFLIGILAIFLLFFLYQKINRWFFEKENYFKNSAHTYSSLKTLLIKSTILLLSITFAIIGIRGGLQLVPINIRNALEVAKSEHTPIVLNTPFSIINSFFSGSLEQKEYMTLQEANKLIKPIKNFKNEEDFKNKNIVLIIMEGLSKEFTKLSEGESYTPFLDELMEESLVFTNAYANGLHSADGIPAIIAGIPSLMRDNFLFSKYSTNTINSFPNLLKEHGYTSVFYHGATNGTMSFDLFAKNAGFDFYYGRNEYNNEEDYDGSWGIFDEPFFQYFASGLDTLKSPFFATFFSVTSHDPFPIPQKYKDRFFSEKLPVYATVEYADYAMRQFFEEVKSKAWFENTLFIITADHTSPITTIENRNEGMARYEIPIIFYAPSDSTIIGKVEKIMSQIDILPSVLDYLNFKKPFFAMGNSIFEPGKNRFIIQELNGTYNWRYENYYLKIAEDEIIESKNLSYNGLGQIEALRMWQAFIQIYNHAMIQDKLTFERYQKTIEHD